MASEASFDKQAMIAKTHKASYKPAPARLFVSRFVFYEKAQNQPWLDAFRVEETSATRTMALPQYRTTCPGV
jgi:hypothetical protein